MKKKALILGIETSCDETAAAILEESTETVPNLLSNIVSSQEKIHTKFGGVVPELAARSHIDKIDLIVNAALKKSGKKLKDIDAIAVTSGPGLIVCLSVGLNFAKALAMTLKKPLIVVNHLEGHALSPKLITDLKYPYLLLLISGGHSQYLAVKKLGKYKRLGTTIDDAVGEAFDKTAKLLGIKFPGGPFIEKLAAKGNKDRFNLPKPIISRGGCNFSFAGLKTAVLRATKLVNTNKDKFDLAASFQKTITDIIYKKTKIAIEEFKKYSNGKVIVVAGGVAANKEIRKTINQICSEVKFSAVFPEINLCGDNAAMIALVGLKKFKNGKYDKPNFPVKPRWLLDKNAKFLKGSGVEL